MACYSCLLKALSDLPGFLQLLPVDGGSNSRETQPLTDLTRWKHQPVKQGDRFYESLQITVITRWMASSSRSSHIGYVVRRIRQQVNRNMDHDAEDCIIVAEPAEDWQVMPSDTQEDSYKKRECKVWVSDSGKAVCDPSGEGLEAKFTLKIEESQISELLTPINTTLRKYKQGQVTRIGEQ